MESFNQPVQVRAMKMDREMRAIANHAGKVKWQWRKGKYGHVWDRHHKKIAEDCVSRVSFSIIFWSSPFQISQVLRSGVHSFESQTVVYSLFSIS
jgi:hypothetical protein